MLKFWALARLTNPRNDSQNLLERNFLENQGKSIWYKIFPWTIASFDNVLHPPILPAKIITEQKRHRLTASKSAEPTRYPLNPPDLLQILLHLRLRCHNYTFHHALEQYFAHLGLVKSQYFPLHRSFSACDEQKSIV